MPQLWVTPDAEGDLKEIWLYIARDAVEAADAFLTRIDKDLRLLAANPRLGRARPELLRGIHSWAIGQYIVFYRPLRGGIEVARVLHGARDISHLLES